MIDPKTISHLNYVVQRNWDNLPDSYEVDGHNDLDLFVSEEDREELEFAIRNDENVDVRSPMDCYYSNAISALILQNRRVHGGFWIPSQNAHFVSLFYHNAVHKNDNPYGEKLKKIFYESHPPQQCTDKGVGFYA